MKHNRVHHRITAAFTTACCLSALLVLPAAPAQAAESTSFASAMEAQAYNGAADAGISTDSTLYTAKVCAYLSVFEEKSTDSTLMGRLYRGAACYVLKTEDDWSYIVSGDVCGWACSYYLVSGEEAEDFLEIVNPRVATVTAGTLRVRSEADLNSDIIARVYEGDDLVVTGSTEDFWRVRLTCDTVGYISKDFAEVESGLATAVSRSEEQQMASELLDKIDSPIEEITEIAEADDEDTSDEESYDEEIAEEEDNDDSEEEEAVEEDSEDDSDSEDIEAYSDDDSSDDESGSWVSLGTFKTTAYCPCVSCNGPSGAGRTASGATPSQGTTIAVDRSVIPLGSKVMIDGHVYIAQDTGVKGHTIDVFFNSHSTCTNYGVQYKEVYIWKD